MCTPFDCIGNSFDELRGFNRIVHLVLQNLLLILKYSWLVIRHPAVLETLLTFPVYVHLNQPSHYCQYLLPGGLRFGSTAGDNLDTSVGGSIYNVQKSRVFQLSLMANPSRDRDIISCLPACQKSLYTGGLPSYCLPFQGKTSLACPDHRENLDRRSHSTMRTGDYYNVL